MCCLLGQQWYTPVTFLLSRWSWLSGQFVDRERYNFSWYNSFLVPRLLPNSLQNHLGKSLGTRQLKAHPIIYVQWVFRRNVFTSWLSENIEIGQSDQGKPGQQVWQVNLNQQFLLCGHNQLKFTGLWICSEIKKLCSLRSCMVAESLPHCSLSVLIVWNFSCG